MSIQNENMNQPYHSDSFYYKTIRFLHSIIVSIKSHVLLFTLCMLLGIIPLLLKNYSDSNLYKASFTVAYDELFRKIYGDRLDKINTLVQKDQPSTLSQILQVDEKSAASLKNISGKNILGDDLSKDLNTDHLPFVVELVADDSSKMVTLQNSIVKFLETGNEFMAERKKLKLLENKEELDYINRQLSTIDTVYKQGKVDGPSGTVSLPSSSGDAADQKSTGSLIEFSYELYKRKQELVRRERMPKTLFIIDDVIVSVQKKKPLVFMVFIGAVAGFIFYTILAAFVIPAFKFKER